MGFLCPSANIVIKIPETIILPETVTAVKMPFQICGKLISICDLLEAAVSIHSFKLFLNLPVQPRADRAHADFRPLFAGRAHRVN